MSEKEKESVSEAKPTGKAQRDGKGSPFVDKTRNAPRPAQSKFTGDCEDLADCIFDYQDKLQSGKLETTMDKLANYVGSKYQYGGDIRKVIKTMAPVVLSPPTAPDPNADRTETKLWELELANHAKRKVKLFDNQQKLYSLIWGQHTPHMKAKLEAADDFADIDADQDPIRILKHIKGMTYRFDGEKYLPHAITEATVRLSRLFQGRDMTNSQYLERFRSMVAVIEHYGGTVGKHPKVIQDELEDMTGVTPTGMDDGRFTLDQWKLAAEHAKNKSLACMFLMGADKTRYGDMLAEIQMTLQQE